MTDCRSIAIYGAGGFAREVAWLLSTLDSSAYQFVGYVEDGAEDGRSLAGVPVLSWERLCASHPTALMAMAIGTPATRARLVQKCAEHDLEFARLVHRSVEMSASVRLGVGVIVCCGSVLTVDIDVGDHVHVNLNCTIGHDVRIGECTTLAPGVHVSGNVHIGRRVYIGTGATIVNGTPKEPLVVGDGTVIAAGACLTRSAEPQALYAGVPAQLKKRYV
jgi:sugar O-acyltransferase (sialic acid O-acetyltransferase NeuD family)